uniref:Ribosomal protein S7 n=1 Tax=Thalassiosira pseudonana TaxID=35128 RepID=Q3S294_THAPS|nr:ribosomal protein S7 [Thalassiosira pseudonana]AAZ99410.1 ribosomal protein S7 [Thalassiosira pseudonana]QWM92930.1 ribosomal protein S7 [Thalassiosira pseudonana]
MNRKIINQLLLNGKVTISEKIWIKSVKFFYKSFTKNYKKFINRALINMAPLLKVKQLKQKRKRSRLKEFPYIVKDKNRISLALKFFLTKKKNKADVKIHKKLLTELLSSAKNMGTNVTKKKSLYEYAFVKKKYFYYRWF